MSKASKSKKGKVPKITEEEYAAYLSSLREMTEGDNPTYRMNVKKDNEKSGNG